MPCVQFSLNGSGPVSFQMPSKRTHGSEGLCDFVAASVPDMMDHH
jgi:hypothetical protein